MQLSQPQRPGSVAATIRALGNLATSPAGATALGYVLGKRSSRSSDPPQRFKKSRLAGVKTTAATSSSKLLKRGKRRKTKKSQKSKINKLSSRLKKLEKYGVQLAKRLVRANEYGQCKHDPNGAAYDAYGMWQPSTWEAHIDDLRFIDRGATPAIDDINLQNQTIGHDIHFINIVLTNVCRNNGQIPVNCATYWYRSKVDTSTSPLAHMTSMDDQMGITDANVNFNIYPTDFKANISKQWKLLKVAKATLNGGDELKSSVAIKHFQQNPKYNDIFSSTYSKGSVVVLVRTSGVIAHDATTTTEVGTGDGGVDIQHRLVYTIVYPSDANFRDIQTVNGGGTFGAAPEVVGPNVDDLKDEL